MHLIIPETESNAILSELSTYNKAFQSIYKGDSTERQPVHTVYGGANLFTANTIPKMGTIALNTFYRYAENFIELAKALELQNYEQLPNEKQAQIHLLKKMEQLNELERKNEPSWLAYTIYQKIELKLKTEPVEDFRIDFEDGYGNRPWDEEDAAAQKAAVETAQAMKSDTLSPFFGIRIKPLTEELKERSIRTLNIYLGTLLKITNGKLPANFVVMLPKVTIVQQIEALVNVFDHIENTASLPKGTLKMEMMVETPQSIIDNEGKSPLSHFFKAAKGRMIGASFGTYDYTAACNITAKYQDMKHISCDFAHHIMQVSLAQTGIWLSDGATNAMPIGPHRGDNLTAEQLNENRAIVHKNWKIAYDNIRYSLWKGLYQGWDLNPAQIPIRYAAVYAFFLESQHETAQRLSSFIATQAKATLTSDMFDDAASGQGLLNYFLRGLSCGALTEADLESCGLTPDEIKSRSFLSILENRRK
jgi:citrate lyase beta subunit